MAWTRRGKYWERELPGGVVESVDARVYPDWPDGRSRPRDAARAAPALSRSRPRGSSTASVRTTATSSRPRRRASAVQVAAAAAWTVDLTPLAAHELRAALGDWDGREYGGAFAGRIGDGKIRIEHAGGLGVQFVDTPRGPRSMIPPIARYRDFAESWGCQLVGGFHTHPADSQAKPSKPDLESWARLRIALKAPAVVGMILSPHVARVRGIAGGMETAVSWSEAEIGVYVLTENGCEAVPPPPEPDGRL